MTRYPSTLYSELGFANIKFSIYGVSNFIDEHYLLPSGLNLSLVPAIKGSLGFETC